MEKTKVTEEIVEKSAQGTDEIIFIIGGQEEADEKEAVLLANIENSYGSVNMDEFSEAAFDLLVNKIASALNTVATQQFKGNTFIEPLEIENIKKSIKTENCSNEKKAELEKELTKFQNEITANYKQKLAELDEKRIAIENQLLTLTKIKNSLVMKRVSQMLWPFNAETAKYESKIASLKIQLAKCEQKIQEIEAMRPAAGEKDLLLFQVQLKEKFNV